MFLLLSLTVAILVDLDLMAAKTVAVQGLTGAASKFCLEPPIRSGTPLLVDTFKNGAQMGQQSCSD